MKILKLLFTKTTNILYNSKHLIYCYESILKYLFLSQLTLLLQEVTIKYTSWSLVHQVKY
jgi:hypothetical protein